MDWIWPSHGPFDYVSLPKGKKDKIEGCIILLLDISPQKSCSSWFTSWFTDIWGHTMGVCLMLRDGIRQKSMYTLIKSATFFKKNTHSTMFYTHQKSIQSSMKSNPFNPGQTYDLSVKTHVFLGQKMVLPKGQGRFFQAQLCFRAWRRGHAAGVAFWFDVSFGALVDYIWRLWSIYPGYGWYINTWIITHIHDFTYIYIYVLYICINVCVCST